MGYWFICSWLAWPALSNMYICINQKRRRQPDNKELGNRHVFYYELPDIRNEHHGHHVSFRYSGDKRQFGH